MQKKIRTSLSEPYRLSIHQSGRCESQLDYHCTTSIGVALFAAHEESLEEILKRSDAAMYEAKQAGRNQVRFHAGAHTQPGINPAAGMSLKGTGL